ncbi:unnamed protein product [Ceutorhynchus assimilis]|uniref:Uncharacterized protein n=1 Tax=Ceutorhynchus assimilis TaxID=467358 RepID=A0A9N9MUC5_9CUCU|nr:unnamed protein product [Ceutorhynchus assimilis]
MSDEIEDEDFFENKKSATSMRSEREESQEHIGENCVCIRKCPLTCGLILIALGILVYITIIICTLKFKIASQVDTIPLYNYYYTDYAYLEDVKEKEGGTSDEAQLDPSKQINGTSNNDTGTDNTETPPETKKSKRDEIGIRDKYTNNGGNTVTEQKASTASSGKHEKSTTATPTKLEECIRNARF